MHVGLGGGPSFDREYASRTSDAVNFSSRWAVFLMRPRNPSDQALFSFELRLKYIRTFMFSYSLNSLNVNMHG